MKLSAICHNKNTAYKERGVSAVSQMAHECINWENVVVYLIFFAL